MLYEKDCNWCQPIHEATRGGYKDDVKLFIAWRGCKREDQLFGERPSLLEIVLDNHEEEHPLFGYLESLGAE